MPSNIGLAAAFGAGLLSFLSPCVLPMIPGYLSFMTGLSISELGSEDRSLSRVLIPALLFVAGFSLIFVAFGATASVLGQALLPYRGIVEKVAGIALVAFGVLMLGVIKVPWLYAEARGDLSASSRFGRGGAFVMGMAFAAGWTPCVGPMLAGILALAGSTGSVAQGTLLLLVYSLGLGLPFIAVSLLFGRASRPLRWMSRHALVLNRTAGAILIVTGFLIMSGRLGMLASWLTSAIPFPEV